MTERTLEQQEKIAAYWLKETKNNVLISKLFKLVLWFFLLMQPIAVLLLARQVNYNLLIIALGFLIYLPVVFYVWSHSTRIPRLIKKGSFKNITHSVPAKLGETIADLSNRMGLRSNSIEIWVNNSSYSASPSICSYKDKSHLILPLGFFKLINKNEDLAKVIVAHEFSHIRQRDADLLVSVKLFIKAILIIVIPLSILIVSLLISNQLNHKNEARQTLDSRRSNVLTSEDVNRAQTIFDFFNEEQRYLESADQASWGIIRIILGYLSIFFVYFLLRKIILRSERIADLGAVCFVGSAETERALHLSNSEKNQFFLRRLFNLNPTVGYRINKIAELNSNFENVNSVPIANTPPPVHENKDSFGHMFFTGVLLIFLPITVFNFYYQLFTSENIGNIMAQNGALLLIQMLLSTITTTLGMLAGMALIEVSDKIVTTGFRYIIVSLLAMIIDSLLIADYTDKTLLSAILLQFQSRYLFLAFYFAFGLFLFLYKKKITNRQPDTFDAFFATYRYDPSGNYIQNLPFSRSLIYVICFSLTFYSIGSFLITYSELFLFSLSTKGNILEYLHYLSEDRLLFLLLFLRFFLVAFGIVAALSLWQRKPETMNLLKKYFWIFIFVQISSIIIYSIDTGYTNNISHWYFIGQKMEDGLFFGKYILIAFKLLFFCIIGLIAINQIKKKKQEFNAKMYAIPAVSALFLVIVSAFIKYPHKNPDVVSVISTNLLSETTNLVCLYDSADHIATLKNMDAVNESLEVWDIEKSSLIRKLKIPKEMYNWPHVVQGPGSLAAVNFKDSICIVDLKTGNKIKTLSFRINYSGSFSLNKDWTHIAYKTNKESLNGSQNNLSEMGEELLIVRSLASDSITSIINEDPSLFELSPDGKTIASYDYKPGSDGDGIYVLSVRNLQTQSYLFKEDLSKNYDFAFAFSSDSKSIAFIQYGNLFIKSLSGSEPMLNIELGNYGSAAKTLKFSHSNRYIAVGGDYGNMITIWDIEKRSFVRQIQDKRQNISSIIFSTDDKYIFSSGSDGEIKKMRTGL